MEREELDALLEAHSKSGYQKPKPDLMKEIKYMTKSLVIYLVLSLIGSAIIIGLLLLFGFNMDQIAYLMTYASVIIIAITFLYLFLGYKAGSALYMTNMWRSAWTNKKTDNKFAYNEFRQYLSLGNISIFLLVLGLINFIYFFVFY
jgi:hypothetical protein